MAKKQVTLEMAELFRSGMTMQQIGDRYGVSRQRVQQRLASVGITGDVRPPQYELLDKTRLELLYVDKRLSIDKIGSDLRVSADIIYRALSFHKIPSRRSVNSDGKHINIIRQLNTGETVEVECTAKNPYVVLHKSAKCAGMKISLQKLEDSKFKITRIG